MCVIAAKAKGVKMPEDEIIRSMWYSNKDGAGLMYTKDNKVVIDKGYMTLDSFEKRLESLEEEIDATKEAVVLHFRIETHGGVTPENCHPFPITDSIGALKKLRIVTNIGVVHNGIIDIKPRTNISDTMEYIASQLAPLKRAIPKFYKNPHILTMINNAIDSKMVFMNNYGELTYIGDFVAEDDGMVYSNYSYVPYSWYRNTKYYDDEYLGYYVPLTYIGEDFYIITPDGEYEESDDYLIDEDLKLYQYNWDTDTVKKVFGYQIFNRRNGDEEVIFDPEFSDFFWCEYDFVDMK